MVGLDKASQTTRWMTLSNSETRDVGRQQSTHRVYLLRMRSLKSLQNSRKALRRLGTVQNWSPKSPKMFVWIDPPGLPSCKYLVQVAWASGASPASPSDKITFWFSILWIKNFMSSRHSVSDESDNKWELVVGRGLSQQLASFDQTSKTGLDLSKTFLAMRLMWLDPNADRGPMIAGFKKQNPDSQQQKRENTLGKSEEGCSTSRANNLAVDKLVHLRMVRRSV